MVTAVKRWISYEVGNGSSVGAVVFRWIDDEWYEDNDDNQDVVFDDYEEYDDQLRGLQWKECWRRCF